MRPDILPVTAGFWREDGLPALGHPDLRMPHLDALAANDLLFARHYAGAAPCLPPRASLYSGPYRMNHRVDRDASPFGGALDPKTLAPRP